MRYAIIHPEDRNDYFEKVIYLADYIEPGRHFPGVEEVREMAEKDLDHALLQAD